MVGVMIANLRLNGVVITNNVIVNNMVALPGGGFLVINEQIRDGLGNTAGITVNGVHVIIPGVADDIISSAHSDIVCVPTP